MILPVAIPVGSRGGIVTGKFESVSEIIGCASLFTALTVFMLLLACLIVREEDNRLVRAAAITVMLGLAICLWAFFADML